MRKALSDVEWAGQPALSTGAPTNVVYWEGDNLVADGWFEGSERHALAALCLHGQPFGFTHEDVDLLKVVTDHWPSLGNYESDADGQHAIYHRVDALQSLADRIGAILPPR
jgi:hypothetical protein